MVDIKKKRKHNIFTFGNLEGRDHLQGLGVEGSQYKSDLKYGIWKMRTGFIWLRNGDNSGFLVTRKETLEFNKNGETLE